MNSARKKVMLTTASSTSSTGRTSRSSAMRSPRSGQFPRQISPGPKPGRPHLRKIQHPTRPPTASQVIDNFIGEDEELREMVRQEVLNAEIGQLIYDARTKTGLTQKQLAHRLGTTQSVISRLESADYEGHSLSMLQRIAEALGQKLELRLSVAA
jgi:ribosome-binding protein aMBF1 (putative translation factor)